MSPERDELRLYLNETHLGLLECFLRALKPRQTVVFPNVNFTTQRNLSFSSHLPTNENHSPNVSNSPTVTSQLPVKRASNSFEA